MKPSKPVLLPSQMFIPHNSEKAVSCKVDHSNPPARIIWFKEHYSEGDTKYIEGKSGYWHSATSIKWSHGPGNYVCEASNRVGRSSSTLIVMVGSAPSGESSDGSSAMLVGLCSSFGIIILVMCIMCNMFYVRR